MIPITIIQDENNSDIELDTFLGKISIQDKHDQESITIALDKWQEVKETIDSMIGSLNEEPTDRFIVELTKDEIDQCTHALSEWCEVLHKEEYPSFALRMKDFENTIKKLDNALTQPKTSIDRFAMGTPAVGHAGENKEVEPSTGQTWTHKQKGYDVKIDYINRTGDIVVEEVATGQRDGFSRKVFLERFSPKSKEGDL